MLIYIYIYEGCPILLVPNTAFRLAVSRAMLVEPLVRVFVHLNLRKLNKGEVKQAKRKGCYLSFFLSLLLLVLLLLLPTPLPSISGSCSKRRNRQAEKERQDSGNKRKLYFMLQWVPGDSCNSRFVLGFI